MNEIEQLDKIDRMRRGEKIKCTCGKGYISAVGEDKRKSNYFRCDVCGLHIIPRMNVKIPFKSA